MHRTVTLMAIVGILQVACSDDNNDVADTNVAPDATVAPDTDVANETVEDAEDAADAQADADTTVPWTPNVYTYPTCGATAAELAGCVEGDRLSTTLAAIAGSRYPGEAKWQAAQDLCKSTFEGLGYTTVLQPTLLGMNVIGTKTGSELPDEQVIIGAHYDGVRGCDAADDNGSGVAGLLESARVLASGTHKRTLVLACWDVEELGLIGSKTHAASVTPANVKAVYNYEMIGYTDEAPGSQQFPPGFDALFPDAGAALAQLGGRGTFIALIAGANMSGPMAALASAAQSIGLPTVPVVLSEALIGVSALADLRRSDHAPFWARGIPAVQITDTANFRNPNYHCPAGNPDTIATLDMPFMRAVVAATVVAAKTTLDAVDPGTSLIGYAAACDIDAQDCGAGKRCTFADDGGAVKRTCVDLADQPAAQDEVCTRPNGLLGHDTCAAGLFCSFYGGRHLSGSGDTATYERVCSPLCAAADDCGEQGRCMYLSDSLYERMGYCRPSCADPFGTSCGDDQKCAPQARIEGGFITTLICTPAGPAAAGEGCTYNTDCGVGHACAQNANAALVCTPYCDAAHACAPGYQCDPLSLDEPVLGLGLCRPD